MTIDERFGQLTHYRQQHTARVMEVMEALARTHNLDIKDARLAGYGHDLAREMPRTALLAEAMRLGLSVGSEEQEEPLLLHGPIAAQWLEEDGLGNSFVWEAIQYHTTAASGLSRMAKALFVADGVEPGREYAGRDALYRLALRDLDAGYSAVLKQTQAYLNRRGLKLHPHMVQALANPHCQLGEESSRTTH